ncbi:hypothetical protein M5689_001006 [Euphorbia peplus]|nr:hypothetical protein M5689_001006 [Euphorbia peplus]
MGRKAAKAEARGKEKSSSSSQIIDVETYNKHHEEKMLATKDLVQQGKDMYDQGQEMIKLQEFELLTKDTTRMNPGQLARYEKMCERITKKYDL